MQDIFWVKKNTVLFSHSWLSGYYSKIWLNNYTIMRTVIKQKKNKKCITALCINLNCQDKVKSGKMLSLVSNVDAKNKQSIMGIEKSFVWATLRPIGWRQI